MGAFNGSRCCRLAAAAVLVFVVWQLVERLCFEQPSELSAVVAPPSSRRVPVVHFPGVDPPAAAEPDDNSLQKTGHPVQVEVFYEALCPDSMNFIVDQLAPAVSRLPQDVINVILVPYGKATTQYHDRPDRQPGDPPAVSFSCQHGPEECWANKVHACGIRQAAHQTLAVRFATCLMKHYRKIRQNAEECARSNGLQWRELAVCAEDEAINADMERYGSMTHALKPRATFIPTITVDGSQAHQGDMFGHFLGFVCKAYEARAGTKAKGCP